MKITKEIYEIIMTKNLPKLMSDVKSQIQEAQQSPEKIHNKQTKHPYVGTSQSNY